MLPVLIFIVSVRLACQILGLSFERYLTFAIVDLLVSSLCLSPVLCLLVYGRLLLPYPVLGERSTLAYFFAKLPLLYSRVPAYLLVCVLIIVVTYLCNLLLGTYLTSRLMAFDFWRSLVFSYSVMLLSCGFLSLSLMLTRGIWGSY